MTKISAFLTTLLLVIFLFAGCSKDDGGGGGIVTPTETEHTISVSNQVHVTQTGYHPKWSPDGTKIVYTVWNPSNNEIELRMYDVNNDEDYAIVQNMSGDLSPNWRPDGEAIVFDAQDANERPQIFEITLSTNEIKQITQLSSPCFNPVYKNSVNEIAFVNMGVIKVINIDSGSIYTISGTENSIVPDISPDGTQLVYAYDPNFNNLSDLYVINVDGTQKSQITNYSGTDTRPQFSSDGNIIIFQRVENNVDYPAFFFFDNGETLVVRDLSGCGMPNLSQSMTKIAVSKTDGIYVYDIVIE